MQRAFLRQLSGAFLGAALIGLTPLAAQAQTPLQTAPSSNFEMAGIRLGMTEAEARAAIRAFDPTLRITSVMGVFNYNDGVNHALRTPEFLDRLEGADKLTGLSQKQPSPCRFQAPCVAADQAVSA